MCPACFASATLLIAATISAGGVTALGAKFLRRNNRQERNPNPNINSTKKEK
ncbi:MAG: hypothetical protein WA715_14960 [Candidatus Acidiferrum sp.]|jgi:hypothetical protein